jgi:REP element-mobilizing transposase RayT
MRKENPTRYSSAVGEAWLHVMFKVKYCHKIFDITEVREECYKLLQEAAEYYTINLSETGFDSDHLHFIADMGLRSKPEIAKCLKGYVARKLLARFPEVKKKYFWDSGLWNPSYYMDGARNLESLVKYVKKQKYGNNEKVQMKLCEFVAS